jgi:hypothetical protein
MPQSVPVPPPHTDLVLKDRVHKHTVSSVLPDDERGLVLSRLDGRHG